MYTSLGNLMQKESVNLPIIAQNGYFCLGNPNSMKDLLEKRGAQP